MSLRLCIGWGTPDGVPFPFSSMRNAVCCVLKRCKPVLRRFKPVGVIVYPSGFFSCLKTPLKRSEGIRAPLRISHPLDARVAALRAAVGCGWTYRRGAAWAWHAMPICAPLCLVGNYGASRLRCLRGSTHEACETVLDGSRAFPCTQYAMRRAEGAARGVTSLH